MSRAHVLTLILLFLLPVAGHGQEPATLDRVDALMARGRIPEAREVLEAWWGEKGPQVGRLERQRSLWLRARLTVDPSLAELDFRRLVLEFPGGPFSDDALLRLAQSAVARGDLQGAAGQYAALARGYPASPHTPGARAWIQRHPEAADAARAEIPKPGATPQTPAIREGTLASEVEGDFAVQLGAFRDVENATALAESLRSGGFQPRIVRLADDGLTRVRIGRFRIRDGAEALRRTLQAAGFEATIVTDAHAEERVR